MRAASASPGDRLRGVSRFPGRPSIVVASFLAAPLLVGRLAAQDAPGEIRVVPASAVATSPATSPAPRAPRTWGTTQINYASVGAQEMVSRSDATHYDGTGQLFRYQTNTTGLGLQATLHLPGGARILSLQLDYYDTSLTGEVLAELDVCSYDGSSCVPQLGFLACSDALVTACSGNVNAPGWSNAYADLSGANLVVNNYLSGYRILAGNTTNDGGTAIWRVLVGYLLQVSPDPPTASFNDVPTSHPFHQYVEALFASQVTAGCGGNDYCPDSPLTRGQMAVFLSKALGLQWP